MTSVQVAVHSDKLNRRERGISPKLVNYNCEIRIQDEAVRVVPLNSTERTLSNLRNASNQRTYRNTQYQSTTDIDT